MRARPQLSSSVSLCAAILLMQLAAGCAEDPQPAKPATSSTSSGSGGGGGMAGMGGSSGAGGGGTGDPITPEPQPSSLLIQVRDTSNKPIPSAFVTALGGTMRPTDGAGYILYENLVPGRFSARVEKWGYAPASVVVELPEGAHGGTDVRLIPLPPRIAFDAAAGAALDQGPVHVTIPSNAIVDANGEPFTGKAEATIVPLDPTTGLATAPGPLQGVQTDGSEVGLESLFMAEITLWNGAQQLQLAPGTKVTIEMVLPDSIASNVQMGQSIPAWYFDLDAGIWREEGAGTVGHSIAEPGKTSWITHVGHFTWWNCDAPWTEKHCFIVPVWFSDASPVPDLQVRAEGVNYWGTSTTQVTGNNGHACIDIKHNGTAKILLPNVPPENLPMIPLVEGMGIPSDCAGNGASCTLLPEIVLVNVTHNPVCNPNTIEQCSYPGPPSTQNRGLCKAGSRHCNVFGTNWSNCIGEVLPQAETCDPLGDTDCDGLPNEGAPGCPCEPAPDDTCYSGPSGTIGIGACSSGHWNCVNGLYDTCSDSPPKAETCSTTNVDDDCDEMTDCRGTAIWSKDLGSAPFASVTTVDSFGNVIVAGWFIGTVDFGGGPIQSANAGTTNDIFVAKFDPNGNHLWSKRFGGSYGQYVYEIGVDSADNVLITGQFGGTVDFGGGPLTDYASLFVVKLSPAGEHIWSKSFENANSLNYPIHGSGMAIDSIDNIVLAGWFWGPADFGSGMTESAGGSDYFLVKLDSNGNHLWSKRFGDADDQYLYENDVVAVATDSTGNVVIAGSFDGTMDFGGGTVQSAVHTGLDGDVFVAKFDSNGNHLWSKHYGDEGDQAATTVTFDNSGNVLISGYFGGVIDFGTGPLQPTNSLVDMFLSKLDPNGSHIWTKHIGGWSGEFPTRVIVDSANNIVLTGYFGGTMEWGGNVLTTAGSADAFVAMLDSTGNHQWSRRFGDESFQRVTSAGMDSVGNIVITGDFYGSIDFGDGPVTNTATGNNSANFLAKLTP